MGFLLRSPARAAYLIVGLLGIHLLHLARFKLVGWQAISAFPDYQIPLSIAFWLSIPLAGVTAVVVGLALRRSTLGALVCGFLITELCSQVVGRSLMKFVLDLGLWSTVTGHYFVVRMYGPDIVASTGPRALTVLHAEVLGMLRTMANVCMFVIGTLGISIASNVLSHYFTTDLGQGTSWFYVAGILYLAMGMYGLILLPLFKAVMAVRRRIESTAL